MWTCLLLLGLGEYDDVIQVDKVDEHVLEHVIEQDLGDKTAGTLVKPKEMTKYS